MLACERFNLDQALRMRHGQTGLLLIQRGQRNRRLVAVISHIKRRILQGLSDGVNDGGFGAVRLATYRYGDQWAHGGRCKRIVA